MSVRRSLPIDASSNYPAASVQTAFCGGRAGDAGGGQYHAHYGAYATLIAMQEFESYGGTQNVVQTWEITGVGELAGARTATVEVVAVVETPKVPANNYAAFATADCLRRDDLPGQRRQSTATTRRGLVGATEPDSRRTGRRRRHEREPQH